MKILETIFGVIAYVFENFMEPFMNAFVHMIHLFVRIIDKTIWQRSPIFVYILAIVFIVYAFFRLLSENSSIGFTVSGKDEEKHFYYALKAFFGSLVIFALTYYLTIYSFTTDYTYIDSIGVYPFQKGTFEGDIWTNYAVWNTTLKYFLYISVAFWIRHATYEIVYCGFPMVRRLFVLVLGMVCLGFLLGSFRYLLLVGLKGTLILELLGIFLGYVEAMATYGCYLIGIWWISGYLFVKYMVVQTYVLCFIQLAMYGILCGSIFILFPI